MPAIATLEELKAAMAALHLAAAWSFPEAGRLAGRVAWLGGGGVAVAAVAAGVLASLSSTRAATWPERPNVILIYLDTLRA